MLPAGSPRVSLGLSFSLTPKSGGQGVENYDGHDAGRSREDCLAGMGLGAWQCALFRNRARVLKVGTAAVPEERVAAPAHATI